MKLKNIFRDLVISRLMDGLVDSMDAKKSVPDGRLPQHPLENTPFKNKLAEEGQPPEEDSVEGCPPVESMIRIPQIDRNDPNVVHRTITVPKGKKTRAPSCP